MSGPWHDDVMADHALDIAAIPQLNGMFAPVHDEIDADDLTVTQGAIPDDLVGTYLRNGPNPRFDPIGSYTYPLDGDGMVHGVWFEGGTARYRNRFVETPTLQAEEQAGRALWGGVMDMFHPSADLVGPELAGKDKDLPDVHIVRHAGRYLALAESAPPFELTDELATVGEHDFGPGLSKGICAHPKVDPVTGEMVVFRYDFSEPFLAWGVVAADGSVARPEEVIDLDSGYMIHDFVITERHLVLFVGPLNFDIAAAMTGGSVLAWKPELGMRIAVIDRTTPAGTTAAVQWIHTDAFWVWHFANAFETTAADGSVTITVDYPDWSHPGMGLVAEPSTGGVCRARLDLAAGTIAIERVATGYSEFPRIDDRLAGREHRWFHLAGKDQDHAAVAGEWNSLVRYDMRTGTSTTRNMGATCVGEAIFVPRAGSTGEDDGYVLTYAYDLAADATSLLVLHAADIAGEPVATIATPQRVPFGLHGSWIAAD